MGEVAVGAGDGELCDEGAAYEVGDGDGFEGGSHACDDVGEEVVGHWAGEFDAFEAAAYGCGFDDAYDDGEGAGGVEVWVEFAELDELFGLAFVDEYSGEFHLDEHGGL